MVQDAFKLRQHESWLKGDQACRGCIENLANMINRKPPDSSRTSVGDAEPCSGQAENLSSRKTIEVAEVYKMDQCRVLSEPEYLEPGQSLAIESIA